MTKMGQLIVAEGSPSIIDRYIAAVRVDLLYNFLMGITDDQDSCGGCVNRSSREAHSQHRSGNSISGFTVHREGAVYSRVQNTEQNSVQGLQQHTA